MEFRRGVCSSCEAQFKVPASFQADQAKCKKCGGVVEIGAVEGGGKPSETPTEPAPVKKPVPAKAPAARPKPVAKPVAKPAAKAAPKPAAKAKPVAKPAAAKPRAGAAAKPKAAAGASASTGRSSSRSSSRRGSKAGSSRSSARGSSRRGGDEATPRARRGREPKPKNWGMMVGALVALGALGGGGWWWMNRDAGAQAAEGAEVAQADAATTPVEDAAADMPVNAPADDAANDATTADTGADAGAGDEPATDPEPAPEPKKEKGPEDVDLTVYSWEKFVDTSDDEWTQINAWADTFFDPWAAARDLSKAKEGLMADARGAFPAILNRYNEIDVTTEEGADQALRVQKDLLQLMCNGRNFGWKDGTEPSDHYFNKKVIDGWNKAWAQAATGDDSSDVAWANLTKLDIADVKKARGVTQEQLDELDSLDDF